MTVPRNGVSDVAVACRVNRSMLEFAAQLKPDFSLPVMKQIEDHAEFRKIKSAHEDLTDAVGIVVATGMTLGRLDAVVSLRLREIETDVNMAIYAPGARNIDAPLREFLVQAKELNSTLPLVPDAAKHGEFKIHQLGGYVIFMDDAIAAGTHLKSLQSALSRKTDDELQERTPAVVVDGDLFEISRVVTKSDSMGPWRPGHRFRLTAGAKDHTLAFDLQLEREAATAISMAITKKALGPLAPYFLASMTQANRESKDSPSEKPEPPADALKPSNTRRGRNKR